MTISLPVLVTAHHLGRLREAVRERRDAEALLVTDLVNVRWATGFTGSNGWLVVLPDRNVLVTDRRYGDQAVDQCAHSGAELDVLVGASHGEMVALTATALATVTAVSVEAEHMTLAEHARWVGAMASRVVPVEGVVADLRRTKDEAEITRIALAATIAAEALQSTGPLIASAEHEVVTERDVRDALERRMRELGADGPGYETIVATGGVNASRPHHRPTNAPLSRGDTVIVDVGAAVEGYRSDMTRTYVVGQPTTRQLELFDLVGRSQAAGLATVAPGIDCRLVDAACRDLLAAAGYREEFRHGTGHGVGLQIHEDPYLNSTSDTTLRVGDVVTVEPGVYREDFGGIRLEDLVVVTPDGHRNLTPLAKDSPCPPSPPTT